MDDVIFMPGAPVADAVLEDVTARVAKVKDRGISVGLGTILVGDDGASASYVAKKHTTSEEVGITSHHIDVAAGDQAVIDHADELGLAMVFTGERHFLH